MVRFLIHYHFTQLATWFLFLPLGVIVLASPFLLFSDTQTVLLYACALVNALVLTIFLDQMVFYQPMLRTMPLSLSTIVQTKFSFSYLIITYQLLLFGLIQITRSLNTALSFLIIASLLCAVATNLVLLYHFYSGQQKNTLVMTLVFYWGTLAGFQQLETLILNNSNFLLVLFIILITLVNKRLCLHFAKIKDSQ